MSEHALPLGRLLARAGWLRRLARALVWDSDAAEDIVQETAIAAWLHRPDEDRPLAPWLAKVARHEAADHRRGEQRRLARESHGSESDPASAPSPEQLLGDLQIHRTVAEELAALDEPFRRTVLLRYFDGLSAAEIARLDEIPAGTVRRRLKEGLDRLRVRLDARHGGERKRWLAALAPLAPPRTTRGPVLRGAPLWMLASLGAGAAALVAMPTARPRDVAAGHVTKAATMTAAPVEQARLARLPPPRFSAGILSSSLAEVTPVIDPEAQLRKMLEATVALSYSGFMQAADGALQSGISEDNWRVGAERLAARLRSGYRARPLGTLQQPDGSVSHMWKLELGDKDDDLLIYLSLKAGQVSGFRFE